MLNLQADNIKNLFEVLNASSGILVVTIGNSLRSDDGVGPYIFEHIKNSKKYVVLNAADKPENIIDEAVNAKPSKTIILDAADFGGYAGEMRIIPGDAVPDTAISTHTFPLSIISQIIEKDTGGEVIFIGIQAKSMQLGEGLCREVKAAADELIRIINNADKTDEHHG